MRNEAVTLDNAHLIMTDNNLDSISGFLDAVDSVLNSNTFLLNINRKIAKESEIVPILNDFLRNDFIEKLFAQDIERQWNMFRFFDNEVLDYKIPEGNIVKLNFKIEVINSLVDRRDYLIAMLTADKIIGNFKSYYSKQKSMEEAKELVDTFLIQITQNQEWNLFILKPDFLYSKQDKRGDAYYFEGQFACDTATIISCYNTSYLLLTNGID